ncbi:MAG: OB-fold domain-containing protein [Acidimicrobiales bacterium]
MDEVSLSQTGTLWAWTAVTASPPGYEGAIPYGFGVVELPEGVRIVTRLTEADPANLRYGQQMNFVLVPLPYEGEQVLTYAFAPDPEGSAS